MKNKYGLIFGVAFLAVTAVAFYWLWNQSKTFTINTVVAENLQPIEIETVKDQADDLLFGLQNKANLPISTPTAKMGKDNPFK